VPVTGMQLTTTTGLLECGFTAALGAGTVSETYTALLTSPVFGPGEFRRAIATASLAGIGYEQTAEAIGSSGFNCSITNVTAHLDDESGRIELAVAVRAEGFGGGSPTLISIGFQVTTTSVTA
jgi:hypothetical protein